MQTASLLLVVVIFLGGDSAAADPTQRRPGADCVEGAGFVNLYISDFGINQINPQLRNFTDFTYAKAQIFQDIPRSGQILVVMPRDQEFRGLSRSELTRQIFDGVKARVDQGLAAGTTRFEIQLVQNIKTGGYLDAGRQRMVNEFGAAAYDAIGHLRTDLQSNKTMVVSTYGIVGSNGAKAFTENVSSWRSYMGGVSMFDGRAFKTPTIDTIKALGAENVRIFNTKGDWMAPNVPVAHSIGNHDVVKALKQDFPGITAVWLEPTDRGAHLAGMNADRHFLAKTFEGSSYGPARAVTGRELLPAVATGRPPGGICLGGEQRYKVEEGLEKRIDRMEHEAGAQKESAP